MPPAETRSSPYPLDRRRWLFVALFSGFALYCFIRALVGAITGDWLAVTWLFPAVVTAAVTLKVVSDFRRYGPDSPRFSWRAFFARLRHG